MKNIGSWIRGHRWTVGMIAVIAIFYGLVALGNAVPTREASPVNQPLAEKTVTAVSGAATAQRIDGQLPPPEIGFASKAEILKPEDYKKKEEKFRENLLKNSSLSGAVAFGFLALLIAALFTNVRVMTRISKGGRWIRDGQPLEAAGWGVSEVVVAAVFMFFSEACLVVIELAYFAVSKTRVTENDTLLMLNSLLRDILATGLIFYLLRKKSGQSLRALGLSFDGFWKNVLKGIEGYLASLPFLIIALLLVMTVIQAFHVTPAPQNVVQIYLKKSADPYLIYFTFFVAGLGPVIEEIFFRGWAYRAFRKKWGVAWGAVATSLIFAAFHMNLVAFFPIFVFSLCLCYLFEESGSLIPSMTAHALHNLIMVSCTLGFKALSG